MAGVRVFVSSTCYDLSILRSDIRSFILSLGYEPVMSDYSDVVYDPRIHTHASCIDEVRNCDILVVIIGARFGGKAVPDALSKIDFSLFSSVSKKIPNLEDKTISITQLEVLKAVELGIPVYTFIDKKVYYEHEIYEKNKSNPDVIDKLIFPAIEKPEMAKYIFEFINFIRLRSVGNSVFTFDRTQDIEDTLKKQWAGYFQRLLTEDRYRSVERDKIDSLNDQFENLKTAILSSIQNSDQREITQGIVRYRKMCDFFYALKFHPHYLASTNETFPDVLASQDFQKLLDARELGVMRDRGFPIKTIMLKDDNTFYECRYPLEYFSEIEEDWNEFKQLKTESKTTILETLRELYRPSMVTIRRHTETIEEYVNRYKQQENLFPIRSVTVGAECPSDLQEGELFLTLE